MNRILSIVALVISLIALTLAGHAHLRADRMADEALRRREQKLVDRMWPDMKVIYADLLEGSEGYTGEKPETIEGLFGPLITVFGTIGQ